MYHPIANMKVCMFKYPCNTMEQGKDHEVLDEVCTFRHREASEYILFIGDTAELNCCKNSLSEALYSVIEQASKKFDYICIYA